VDIAKGGGVAPVSIARLVQELEKLHDEMQAGKLKSSEYDQRLARLVRELRELGLDADRTETIAALDDAQRRGVITPAGREHLDKRLGLA
jgi:hypothetical protein